MGVDLKSLFANGKSGEDLAIPNPYEKVTKLFTNEAFFKEKQTVEMNIISKGFKVIKELTYVNIEDLVEPSHDWLIFNRCSENERSELKHSIINNGLFTPLIVWKNFKNFHMILSGVERANIINEIYEEASDEEKEAWRKIPAFVLERDDITNVQARLIRIDSNICGRNLDTISKNNAIVQKYMALKLLKKTRNEFNIIDELSESFSMSRTTITNHLLTQKVIEEFLYLFQQGVLSLKSIKKLSKFSKENQKKILESIGFNSFKNFKVDRLKERDEDNEKSLQSSLKIIKEMKHPYFTTLKIKVPTKFVDDAVIVIKGIIKKNPLLYMKLTKPKIMYN